MGATPKNISKYTDEYAKLYPQAGILLVTTSVADVILRSPAILSMRLQPAITETAAFTGLKDDERRPRILVVAFSNSGSLLFTIFAKTWKQKHGTILPIAALILDSSPDRGDYNKAVKAIQISDPKISFLRYPILGHFILGPLWVIHHVISKENRIRRSYRELNDSCIIPDVPRLYLYSKADEVVDWKDVEKHARAKKPSVWVDMVKFDRSDHVRHIQEDRKRYWDAIEGLWNASCTTKCVAPNFKAFL